MRRKGRVGLRHPFGGPGLGKCARALALAVCCGTVTPSVVLAETAPPGAAVSPDTLETIRTLIARSEFGQAGAIAWRQLRRLESLQSPDSLARARVLELIVENEIRGTARLWGTTSLDRAREAVRIKERVLGADHIELATAVMYLGRVYHRLGRLEEARETCERSLSIRRRWLPPDHPDVATSLHNLARVVHAAGDTARARNLYEETIRLRRRSLSPDHPDLAVSLANLGALSVDRGADSLARPLFVEALGIYERTQPHHFNVSEIHIRLAGIAERDDDYLGTRRHLEAAVRNRERNGHGGLLNALDDLAAFLRRAGDYERAGTVLERILDERTRAAPMETVLTALAYKELGVLMRDMGYHPRSRRLLERAVALFGDDPTRQPPEFANCLVELAATHSELNQDPMAVPLLERALAIQRAKLPPDDPEITTTLLQLCQIHRRNGDLRRARVHAAEALAMASRKLGTRHSKVGAALRHQAWLDLAAGDTARARERFQAALSIAEATRGPGHIQVARALDPVAELLHTHGERDSAIALGERALNIRRRVLGPEHPETGRNELQFARWLAAAGDSAAALDRALGSERTWREHLRLTARTLPEERALGYAAVRPGGLELALALASRGGSAAAVERSWDAVIRARGLVIEEMAARRQRLASTEDSVAARLAWALLGARRRLAHLTLSQLPDSVDPARTLAIARRESEAAEEALAERSVKYREEHARDRLRLADLRRHLPNRAALVAYFRSASAIPSGSDHYFAFVLRAGEMPRLVAIGDAEGVDHLVDRWRRLAERRPTRARARETERTTRQAGEALRQSVWDPLDLGNSERVFVVPDGALQLVNLAALPSRDSLYLVESGPLLQVLTSERDLVHEEQRPPEQGLLALGGPDFDAPPSRAGNAAVLAEARTEPRTSNLRSACGEFRRLRFKPLPAAGRELDDVLSIWQSTRPGRPVALRLSGAGASEAEFKRLAPRSSALHVASHGFFLGGDCAQPMSDARGIGGMSLELARESTLGPDNPLLLAGVALAGANLRELAGPDAEDGILTAAEIAALDLSSVRWAVLSACQTGLGEVRAGEGVLGLRRAFQLAGVGTLVTSLWSVEDESARQWMRAFYEARLSQGLGAAEATREASLQALRVSRDRLGSGHPFHWAAFVASGSRE